MMMKWRIKRVIDTSITYAKVMVIMIISYTISYFITGNNEYTTFVFTASIFSMIVVMILDVCRQLRRIIDDERVTEKHKENS